MSEEEQSNVRPWKARPLVLHGKAKFRSAKDKKGWSSELGWARVLYKPKKDKIVFLHCWKQGPKDAKKQKDKTEWVKPIFLPKAYESMLRYARQRYLDRYKKTNGKKKKAKPMLKGHMPHLCEMCKELGTSCNGAEEEKEKEEEN